MKLKILLFALFAFMTSSNLISQDTSSYWKNGGFVGVNLSQISLSNWAGGGKNTINITGLTNLFANYSKGNLTWTNSLEMGYGVTKLGDEDLRKSDDKLIFFSKMGLKADSVFNYSALLDFRTQFYKGYKFENDGTKIYISNLMAPGYVSLGFGMNYKPADYFELMLAPLSNRVIFVLDDSLSNQGAFGVDKGEKIKVDLGGSMNATLKYPIMENIVFQTRLSIFAPYSNFTSAIVNSETLISMKVNSTININLNIDAIYDERVVINRDDGTKGPATQFRNVLAIGFGYKF